MEERILKLNFFETISKYIIEIPVIQREYAQGRTTERVFSLREKFVADLCHHIINSIPMHLGFVYGKAEGKDFERIMKINQESIETILGAVK